MAAVRHLPERMNVINRPTPMDAMLQVPSEDWFKVHGLCASGLTLDQLLPTLGFLQSKGEVSSIGRTVSSQYGDGVFVRQENSSGEIYNICETSGGKLSSIEEELKESVALIKSRYDWITSGSRLSFGVLCGRRVVMVIDYHGSEHAQLSSLLDIAISVIKEQFVNIDQFNILRCSDGVGSWREGLVDVTNENVSDALDWVGQTTPQTPPLTSNIIQAVTKALEHTEADSVCVLSYGESSLRAFNKLLETVTPSLIPLSLSVFNCDREEKQEQYRTLANASNGRCHSYTPPPQSLLTAKGNPLLSSFSSLGSAGSRSPPLRRPGSGRSHASRPTSATKSSPSVSAFPPGLSDEDTQAVWDELEMARNTLAQIQALHIEIGGACHYSNPELTKPCNDSMTSEQWLTENGLSGLKLMFEDLVRSLAFRHCNGMVQIPLPPKHKRSDKVEMILQTKVVHAQYCKDFVHLRWPEGGVIHITLTKHAHKVYCEGVQKVVEACRERLAWLKDGSRELFGTLLENKIVIVVDTSVSMAKRLGMLKQKLQQLIQEQLSRKDQFTVIHFNSKVYPWRETLVSSSPQTLSAVSQWVEGLVSEGSTNTQAALLKAMSIHRAEAVYLMTDGRPDTPTDTLLAKVQQLAKIPVHTISFNCADSKANHFLAKLSSNTGGRYHYLSEDVTDPEGPKTYQSEDIRRLEEEIKCGLEQLERANQLLVECQVTKRRSGKRKNQVPKKRKPRKAMNNDDSDTDSCTSRESTKVKPLMSSKKWLSKNGLSSLKLTLMDALGPSSIPHTSKHVPIIQKDVHSKVFSELFPLAHVSNDNQMTLIHPNGVNLIDYERKLDEQVSVYKARWSRLAWGAIPDEKKSSILTDCGLEGEQVPTYDKHRTVLHKVLKELEWPRPEKDFDLLEEEIRQADVYHQYSISLRKEGRSRTESRGSELNSDVYSYTSRGSLVPLMDHPLTHSPTSQVTPAQTTKGRSSRPSKSQKVIVRSKVDGFYYPGVVSNQPDKKHTAVQLADGQEVSSLNSLVIPMGGARPCPQLHRGNHALVRVRTRNNGLHPTSDGRCDFYIPGVVQVLPENERKGHALHSVLVFNGKTIMCDRRGIMKINEKRYSETCKFIRQRMTSSETRMNDSVSQSTSSYTESRRSSIGMPEFSPSESEQFEGESNVGSAIHSDHESVTPSESVNTMISQASSSKSGGDDNQSSGGHDLSVLLESQKAQGELIEQYRRELILLQEKQKDMEEQLAAREKTPEVLGGSETGDRLTGSVLVIDNAHDRISVVQGGTDLDDFPDLADNDQQIEPAHNETLPASSSSIEPNPPVVDPPIANPAYLPTGSTTYVNPAYHPELSQSVIHHCDQGMNTEPMMEEKCIGTGPMTESVAVGTEWSQSETETDSDVGEGGKSAEVEDPQEHANSPVQPTPVSTPSRTPAHSVASTPAHTHISTPPQSQPLTPTHSHTQEQSHNSTPAQSHTTSPSHTLTPSPTHLSTPAHGGSHVSPSHNNYPVLTPQITPTRIPLINQQVLARWPDDGWYYRCMLVGVAGEEKWKIEDASGDSEVIHSSDIIMDLVDSQRTLSLGDYVTALHPEYSYSYAPGQIVSIASDGMHFNVDFYDGSQNVLPRQEVYGLPESKHTIDVEYIRKKEAEWVGVACVARNNLDGLYYPGKVESQLPRARKYLINWANGTSQVQHIVHMYGQLTRKRPLRIGDHVIGLADPKLGVCMPGLITGTQQKKLTIEFCDGQSDAVAPTHCFWVSKESYEHAVKYICSHAPTPSDGGVVSTEEGVASVTDEELESGSECSVN